MRHLIPWLSQAVFALESALDELAQQESDEFERFMRARDAGFFLPYRDSSKAGAMKIAARERAVRINSAVSAAWHPFLPGRQG